VIARHAAELDPREPVAYAALAAVHLTAGDPQNAVDAARKAVDLNPSMPESWVWLGFAEVLAGDPEACISATEGRRVRPELSIDPMQNYLAVSRPEIDARRNSARRKAGPG